MDSRDDADETRDDGTDAPESGSTYAYVCPICGARKAGYVRSGSPFERALTALKSHVRQRKGDGHGPSYEIPGDLDCATFRAHVEA